jgi:N-hydroxyarylamine O-acetyltransferase
VLERLGYDVARHLGRVADAMSPRTHLAVLVQVEGQRVLCDPGIGRPPLQPIPLADGAEVTAGGWTHRLETLTEGEAGTVWTPKDPRHTSVSLDGIVVRRPGRRTEHQPLEVDALGDVLDDLGAGSRRTRPTGSSNACVT